MSNDFALATTKVLLVISRPAADTSRQSSSTDIVCRAMVLGGDLGLVATARGRLRRTIGLVATDCGGVSDLPGSSQRSPDNTAAIRETGPLGMLLMTSLDGRPVGIALAELFCSNGEK